MSSKKKVRITKKQINYFLAIIGICVIAAIGFFPFQKNNKKTAAPTLLKMDEGYGTTVKDISNGLSGTINAGTWASSDLCISGKCVLFNGNNSYINFGDNNTYDFTGTTSFTIELWFRHKTMTSGTQVLVAKANSSAGYKIQMESDGDITFGIDDDASSFPEDSVTSTAATYDDNQWHHLAAVKTSNTKIELFIDSTLVASKSGLSATGSLANSASLYLGVDGNGTSNFYQGFLDEVTIYTAEARTSTTVKADATKGAGDSGASAVFSDNNSILNNGLVGYWKMDESSWNNNCATTTVFDSSGTGSQATSCPTSTGPTGGAVGKFGSAGNFDGSDDYLTVADSTDLQMQSHGFSAFTWINGAFTSGAHKVLLTKGGSSAGAAGFWFGITSTNKLDLNISDGSSFIVSGATSTDIAGDNTWHYVGFTWDPNKGATFYIDGAASGFVAVTSSTSINNSAVMRIGGYTAALYTFPGKIDEVRLYNRTLNLQEVNQLYKWSPEPAAYWSLDENGGTTVNDVSGNGNSGTITPGNGKWIAGKAGAGFDFDMSNTFIDITNTNASIDKLPQKAFTATFWMKPRSYGEFNSTNYIGTVIHKTDWNVRLHNSYGVDATINTSGTQALSRRNYTPDDKWHHVAITYDDSGDRNIHIYFDGVEGPYLTQQTATGTVTDDSASDVYLGTRSDAADIFDGGLDDIKLYNYVRTPAQIVSDMNGSHPAPGSPVGSAALYFDFADTTYGDTTHNKGNLGSILDGDLGGSANSCPGASECPTSTNSGKYGKGLSFDGNDMLDTNNNTVLNSTSFSIATWFYRTGAVDASDGAGIAGRWHTNEGAFLWVDPSNIIEFPVGGSPHLSSNTTASLNTWYHVVGTFDGTTSKIYVNGVLKNSQADSTTFNSITQGFEVGQYSQASTTNFTGTIDEVKFYDFALNADQVKTEYNQGQSIAFGNTSTDSSGNPITSNLGDYCVPGDSSVCTPPTAIWNFDENTGNYAYDTSGNANTAGLVNNTKWETGKKGSALFLSADSPYAYASVSPSSSVNDVFASGGTIEAWIYPRTGVANSIVTKGDWILYIDGASGNTAKLYFDPDDSGDTGPAYSTNNNILLNQWNHIAVTYNYTTVQMFINGIKVGVTCATCSTGGAIGDSASTLYFGTASQYTLNGKIDQVYFYKYIRSAAQIAWDYNGGKPILHYKLDDCNGTTAYDASPKSDKGSSLTNLTISIGGSGNYTSPGNCNSGTGTEAWNAGTTGKYNSSLGFDGANDFAYTTDISKFQLTSFSISVWVKPTTFTSSDPLRQYILAEQPQGAWADGRGYALSINPSGMPAVSLGNAGGSWTNLTGYTALTIGVWNHIGITYNGTNLSIYVNGKLDRTSSPGITISYANDGSGGPATQTFYLGAQHNNNNSANTNVADMYFFQGVIDDLRIYNYPLTQIQMKNVYNSDSAVNFAQ